MTCKSIINELLHLPYKIEIRETMNYDDRYYSILVYLSEGRFILWGINSNLNLCVTVAESLANVNTSNNLFKYRHIRDSVSHGKLIWSSLNDL